MSRRRETEPVGEAMDLAGVFASLPEHLARRCRRAFRQHRDETRHQCRESGLKVELSPAASAFKRESDDWHAAWEMFYSRSDVEAAQERARRMLSEVDVAEHNAEVPSIA